MCFVITTLICYIKSGYSCKCMQKDHSWSLPMIYRFPFLDTERMLKFIMKSVVKLPNLGTNHITSFLGYDFIGYFFIRS